MSGYTPGPWRKEFTYLRLNINGHEHYAWTVAAGENGICAVVRPVEEITPEIAREREATRDFIIAAPDLLEAAIRAESMITRAIELGFLGGKPNDPAKIIGGELRAAIAKATGAD